MVSNILLRVGIGVVAAAVLAAVVALFLPSTFEVQESLVIKASGERIHEYVGDLTHWPDWVSWLQEDPDLVVTLGDRTTGVGASQSWQGDSSDGHLVFTRCDPGWGVTYELTFSKNTYTSLRSIQYRAVPEGTEVVWHITGDNGNNLMARYFAGLMPSLIGPQFEEGLARLKMAAEKDQVMEPAVPEG